MAQLAIRCQPRVPVSADELERWLERQVNDLRAAAPRGTVRLSRLTQGGPSSDLVIGWLVELELDEGEALLTADLLADALRDMRLLGLQPALLAPASAMDERKGSVTMSWGAIAATNGASLQPGPPRVPNGRHADGSISGTARAALDRVLELLGRRQLSATELRVLLRLLDREASLSELAEALGYPPVEIRRASRSLAMRGLVRWRHVGRRKRTRLAITAAGLATVRALLTAAGQAADEVQTLEMAIR